MKKITPGIKLLCIFILAVSFATQATAQKVSLGYQLGDVVAAEFTTCPIEILMPEESPIIPNFRTKSYACVVLKLQKNRTVNLVDYSLFINNVKASCVAIAVDMNSFASHANTEVITGNNYIRLLFIYDGSRVKPGSIANGRLALNFAATADRNRSINFKVTNLGRKTFTDVKKIPAAGLLK